MKMKTICVFTKYKDTVSRTQDTKRELFKEGKIIWEAYEIMIGREYDKINWDEIMIIEYSDEDNYDQSLKHLRESSKLEKYRAYVFEPYPKEQQTKINIMMEKAKNDPNVDITPGGTLEELYSTNELYSRSKDFLNNLFYGEYQGDIQVINFMKYPKVAVYEDGHKAKEETGKQTYKNYGRAVMQVQGKLGAHYDASGRVKATIESELDFDWDAYLFVHYPTVKSFAETLTAKTRWPFLNDQHAGLEQAYSYIGKRSNCHLFE
jgi:hypothetical protein